MTYTLTTPTSTSQIHGTIETARSAAIRIWAEAQYAGHASPMIVIESADGHREALCDWWPRGPMGLDDSVHYLGHSYVVREHYPGRPGCGDRPIPGFDGVK